MFAETFRLLVRRCWPALMTQCVCCHSLLSQVRDTNEITSPCGQGQLSHGVSAALVVCLCPRFTAQIPSLCRELAPCTGTS